MGMIADKLKELSDKAHGLLTMGKRKKKEDDEDRKKKKPPFFSLGQAAEYRKQKESALQRAGQ